jgi:hypothetical protein
MRREANRQSQNPRTNKQTNRQTDKVKTPTRKTDVWGTRRKTEKQKNKRTNKQTKSKPPHVKPTCGAPPDKQKNKQTNRVKTPTLRVNLIYEWVKASSFDRCGRVRREGNPMLGVLRVDHRPSSRLTRNELLLRAVFVSWLFKSGQMPVRADC